MMGTETEVRILKSKEGMILKETPSKLSVKD